MYYKGDLAKVYSLQSFFHGGFLNGDFCIVSQNQNEGSSVLVTVCRNMGTTGQYELDFSYEVYEKQLELVITFDKITNHYKNKMKDIFEKKAKYYEMNDEEKNNFQFEYQKIMLKLCEKYCGDKK